MRATRMMRDSKLKKLEGQPQSSSVFSKIGRTGVRKSDSPHSVLCRLSEAGLKVKKDFARDKEGSWLPALHGNGYSGSCEEFAEPEQPFGWIS